MSENYSDLFQDPSQDSETSDKYDVAQTSTVVRAIISARKRTGLTQKELSDRTGIAQGYISRLERGHANPSIRTLQRLASGMGMNVHVEFRPNLSEENGKSPEE